MALIEFIFHDHSMEFTDLTAAESAIRKQSADLRLDYHKVLDTLPVTYKMPLGLRVCALSFVGRQSQTRIDARAQIQERITRGQIAFGILVFKRGTVKPATKAWVNRLLPSSRTVAQFIDDSADHILTTRETCDPAWLSVWHHDSGDVERLKTAIELFWNP